MTSVGKHHKNGTTNGAKHRRQSHQKILLSGLKRRIQAFNGIGIQKRQNSKHSQAEKTVHKVTESQLILRQVRGPRGRPQTFKSSDSVVIDTITAFVTVGETREATSQTTDCNQDAG